MDWLIWLGVAVAAGVVEVLTVDFIFVMVAGGGLLAALSAGLGATAPLQVIVFSAATVLLLVTARPPLKRWAASTPHHVTNAGALVGRDAVVLSPVTDRTGEVKLAGEVWTARVDDAAPGPIETPAMLEPGSAVVVVRIDGATAVVAPAGRPPNSRSDNSDDSDNPDTCIPEGKRAQIMEDLSGGSIAVLIVLALIVIFAITTVVKAVRIVPQATAVIVERLGRYLTTLDAGLHFLVPFVDRPRAIVDLREQVVSFPPQPVITSDNLVVSIDTVIYYQPTDPKSAVYEIANYIQGIEQLTVTTLRNVIGSLDLEQTLTSRDQINSQLRGVLDEATGRWGIRVNRVELKSIDPPASVQDSMEQQMRAERSRRAAILTAEGVKQSQILTAEGDKQSSILRAEGQAQAAVLKAQGESRAILQVFDAIHRGNPDPKLLAYQYLQTLPQIANSASSKLWIVPTELTQALRGISGALGGSTEDGAGPDGPAPTVSTILPDDGFETPTLEDPAEAVRRAQAEAAAATADAESATRATTPEPPLES